MSQFICSITLEPVKDYYGITVNGSIYDYGAILNWSMENQTDPLTGIRIFHDTSPERYSVETPFEEIEKIAKKKQEEFQNKHYPRVKLTHEDERRDQEEEEELIADSSASSGDCKCEWCCPDFDSSSYNNCKYCCPSSSSTDYKKYKSSSSSDSNSSSEDNCKPKRKYYGCARIYQESKKKRKSWKRSWK